MKGLGCKRFWDFSKYKPGIHLEKMLTSTEKIYERLSVQCRTTFLASANKIQRSSEIKELFTRSLLEESLLHLLQMADGRERVSTVHEWKFSRWKLYIIKILLVISNY